MLAKFHIFEMSFLAAKHTPNTTPKATAKMANKNEYAGNLLAGSAFATNNMIGQNVRNQTHTETKAAPIPIATFKKVFIVFSFLVD